MRRGPGGTWAVPSRRRVADTSRVETALRYEAFLLWKAGGSQRRAEANIDEVTTRVNGAVAGESAPKQTKRAASCLLRGSGAGNEDGAGGLGDAAGGFLGHGDGGEGVGGERVGGL